MKPSGNRALGKLRHENLQTHIYDKTDDFHLVNPPDLTLSEAARDERPSGNVYGAELRGEWRNQSEVLAFSLRLTRQAQWPGASVARRLGHGNASSLFALVH